MLLSRKGSQQEQEGDAHPVGTRQGLGVLHSTLPCHVQASCQAAVKSLPPAACLQDRLPAVWDSQRPPQHGGWKLG